MNRMTLQLHVLGVSIGVHCPSTDKETSIRRLLSHHIVSRTQVETPDLLVEITEEADDRFLYRERPTELDETPLPGVRYALPGMRKLQHWTTRYPPLVPYKLSVNEGRFVAFHAGCVSLREDVCVLLPGARGAGKTTSCAHLSRCHDAALISDEVAFVHRRSPIVEPMALPMGVADGPDEPKRPHPPQDICSRIEQSPKAVTSLLFLERTPGEDSLRMPPPAFAMKLLMSHMMDTGTTPDETVITASRLVVRLPAFILRWSSYTRLPELLSEFVAAISLHKAGTNDV